MTWLQLHIDTDPASVDRIENALTEAGAVSVTLQDNADQPVLEPGVGETPLWDATRLTALFSGSATPQDIIKQLGRSLGKPPTNYRFESLEDQDWERSWLDNFTPLRFGNNLWVCPSWQQAPDPDAVVIALDPGLAFGTGTHQTTALCLEWLEQAELTNKVIIDYGCGSGILAIAALLLGAKSAICVDNDPQALIATRANATQNGIDEASLAVCLPEQLEQTLNDIARSEAIATSETSAKSKNSDIHDGFDLVIANILAGPLITLAPQLSGLMAPNGELVLSGILDIQAEQVMQAYNSKVNFSPMAKRDEWVRLNGRTLFA